VPKKLMIVAGETSGDQIAALALKSLIKTVPSPDEIDVFGVGGPALEAAGMRLDYDYRTFSVMGVWDVIRNLGTVSKAFNNVVKLALKQKPDMLVLVDFPGFNLRLARRLKAELPHVMYYISPKYWVWRSSRLRTVAEFTDSQALIFPFEEDDYRELGSNATFVGHPVFDLTADAPDRQTARQSLGISQSQNVLAIFPGSRSTEIKRHSSIIRDCCRLLADQDLQIVLQVAESFSREKANELERNIDGVRVIHGSYHQLMAAADLGLVASGTASLEAAAIGLPHLVFYKIDQLAYILARMFVKVKWASPVNIAANKLLVPEFLQASANGLQLANWTIETLSKLKNDEALFSGDTSIRQTVVSVLGGAGASERTAALMRDVLFPNNRINDAC
jgi:lipid-A-disaccharide synthase